MLQFAGHILQHMSRSQAGLLNLFQFCRAYLSADVWVTRGVIEHVSVCRAYLAAHE
jgi:hypothetical protein